MDHRAIMQWYKDDLETMKLLKVDCLALGMLICIRKAVTMVERYRGCTEPLLDSQLAARWCRLLAADADHPR